MNVNTEQSRAEKQAWALFYCISGTYFRGLAGEKNPKNKNLQRGRVRVFSSGFQFGFGLGLGLGLGDPPTRILLVK